MVNPPRVDRLPPLKVRDLRLDLEQISADFGIEHFETASNDLELQDKRFFKIMLLLELARDFKMIYYVFSQMRLL